MKRWIHFVGTILATVILAANAWAARIPMTFYNEFDTDAIYLFIVDGDYDFTSNITLPTTWAVDLFETDRLVLSGDPLSPMQGTFGIEFLGGRRGDFTLEWAETLGGSIIESGTLVVQNAPRNPAQIVSATYGPITSPVPIPDALWLFASGLVGFVAIRRKQSARKAAAE